MKAWTERKQWILERAKGERGGVDVLYDDFVNAYCEANKVPCSPQWYGAPKCKQLGRDLSKMFKEGLLTRARVGLSLMESGFPKWVFSYRVKEP